MSNYDEAIKKPSFWISNFFIIAATVIGVFLAANQGFEQAVRFDNARSDRNNYYLRKSLQHELSANVGYVREYIGKVQQRVQNPELKVENFVWRSMAFSPSALETPSELLREAASFHRRADEIMNTPYYNVNNKAQYLGELADHIEKDVLPRFEEDTAAIRESLKKLKIDV